MADAVALKELFLKSTGVNLFTLLEKELKTEIPSLVKNVLTFFEYNCTIILAKLDDGSITSMEQNIRNDISADILLPGEKMEDFLGRFTKCQGKFKFLDGQRKWLTLIAQTCRHFVEDIDPPPAIVSAPDVPVLTGNDESSNQADEPTKGKPVPALVTDDNLKELEELIFDWISSKTALSNCVESSPMTFNVVVHGESGTVTLKCPISECSQYISLSLLRYPKYNKTKRPRRGAAAHLSAPKWYIYGLQSHLLKNHSNEATEDLTIDDRAPTSEPLRDNTSGPGNQQNDFSVASAGEEFNGFPVENRESNSNDNTRNGEDDQDSDTSNRTIANQKSLKRKVPPSFTLRQKHKKI